MDSEELGNSIVSEKLAEREIKCHRCYGTGEDDEGADCIFCEGYGTVIVH